MSFEILIFTVISNMSALNEALLPDSLQKLTNKAAVCAINKQMYSYFYILCLNIKAFLL